MAGLVLSRKVAADPGVQALARRAERAQSVARSAKQQAKAALPPLELGLWVQGGAVLAALSRVYLGESSTMARSIGAGLAGALGSTQGDTRYVALASGLIASLVEEQVVSAMQRIPAASDPSQIPQPTAASGVR